MLDRLHVRRASWTLIDQALVSAGTFLVNIQLARTLPISEYGTFALLLGALLLFQITLTSLLFYPLTVRLSVAETNRRASLLATTYILFISVAVPLAILLAIGIIAFERPDLALPAAVFALCWQGQEAMRRGLLATFRHADAVPGDALAYMGQAAAVFVATQTEDFQLAHAFYAMAAASACSAVVQACQLRLSFAKLLDLRETARDYWSIGSWSMINTFSLIGRIQLCPWALAFIAGPAAAAPFQAVLNIVNLTNPIIFGLGNIIPQTAAQARRESNRNAWTASRTYILMGIPPAFGFYALAFAFPGIALWLFYGDGSPYLDLTLAVRLIVAAWAIGYAADLINSFLYGVDKPRQAFTVNVLGLATAAALLPPLIAMFDLLGAIAALIIANVVRTVAANLILARVTSEGHVQPASAP